jgi:thioredoxin-dependent peroxiredoxin
MLTVGSLAPEIDTLDNRGRRFRLSEPSGRLCTVLYFFPRAFTPGCTRETEVFRDNWGELFLAGAGIAGVSTDALDTQCAFADAMHAPFPLLADKGGAIAKDYDVRWPLVAIAQRVTYVVDSARRIAGAFHHELQIGKHRDDVLRAVDELYRAKRGLG